VRSPFGQGYSAEFLGPLATNYPSAVVRDANSKIQIFAGASTGQLYQLYTGSDDAGSQFTGDAIGLLSSGEERPSVPYFDWYGDSNVDVQISQVLATTLGTPTSAQENFQDLTPALASAQIPQGYEKDFRYRVQIAASEMHHTYLRLQLISHSADGSLALNSPVHLPIENYGRIYMVIPILADRRGA